MKKLRVIVCGSTFGQYYIRALQTVPDEFEVVGLLANGSNRSKLCADFYHVPLYTQIEDIEYAIRKEVSRHDALRTIFYKNGRQKILNNVPDYSVIVTKCQNDEEKEIELQKQRKILSHKVYDHEKWPLFTFQMIESPNSRILMVSLDLMVCDGDSMQILFTEIADTLEGKSDAEKIEYSYAEYIQNISKLQTIHLLHPRKYAICLPSL